MYNKEEILKMKKWSPEYKRIYQQLYYRLKTEKITNQEFEIFLCMREKRTEKRSIYHRKSHATDNYSKDKLFLPTFKKLDKPILITFD